jgi:hypothetical protein
VAEITFERLHSPWKLQICPLYEKKMLVKALALLSKIHQFYSTSFSLLGFQDRNWNSAFCN